MKVGNHNVTDAVKSVVVKDTERPSNKYSPYIDITEDWDKKKSPNDTREDKSSKSDKSD